MVKIQFNIYNKDFEAKFKEIKEKLIKDSQESI